MLFFFCRGYAQVVKPLKTGDIIPETLWDHSFQTITKQGQIGTLELRKLRGKLIIIDFWATWCSSCVQTMPELHKLQAEFGDNIAIVSQTYENKDQVRSFLKTNLIAKENLEFSITDDTVLKNTFPHRLLPHFVWIDQLGTVMAITSTEAINRENVERLLSGNSVKMASKTDLDPELPLFMSPLSSYKDLLQYSVLSKGNFTGLASGNLYRKTDSVLRGHAFTNTKLGTIYRIIARQIFKENGLPFSSDKIVIKLEHPDRLEEIYNFELMVPVSNASELYTDMLADLNKSLPYLAKLITTEGNTFLIVTDKK